MRLSELDDHVANDCSRRRIRCALGCGERILAMQQRVHGAHACAKRGVPCAMCAQTVLANELEEHKESHCPMRVVDCPHRGCYKRLPLAQVRWSREEGRGRKGGGRKTAVDARARIAPLLV